MTSATLFLELVRYGLDLLPSSSPDSAPGMVISSGEAMFYHPGTIKGGGELGSGRILLHFLHLLRLD